MNYALIEDGVVANIIWVYEGNAHEFANAVPMGEVPAGIGDSWDGGHFFRDGERLLTPLERVRAELAETDAALLEAAYQNAIGGFGE